MADIPMLAGWDTGLQNLPQLGQNLRDIFNPNYNIQQLFKVAIAKDPSILQTFANTPNAANVLQNLGFGNAISQGVGSIGVDPTTQLNRTEATNTLNALRNDPSLAADNASVKATGQTGATRSLESTRANVAAATAPSEISQAQSQAKIAENQVKITGKAADDAMREMNDNAVALTKFPSLAGIDINQLAQKIVSGQPVDPVLIQRVNMDPAAGKALEQFQAALMQRMEMANRMSVAQITSNREFAGMALQYLGGQQSQIRSQLQTAAQIVHDQAPTMTDLALAAAPPKDQNDQASMSLYTQAKAKVDNYNEAKRQLQSDSPLMKSLSALDEKTMGIANAIGAVNISGVTSNDRSKVNPTGNGTGKTTSTRVSTTSQGNGGVDINLAANNIRAGNASIDDLNAALKQGKINQAQYNAIKKLVSSPTGTMSRSQFFNGNIP